MNRTFCKRCGRNTLHSSEICVACRKLCSCGQPKKENRKQCQHCGFVKKFVVVAQKKKSGYCRYCALPVDKCSGHRLIKLSLRR